MAEITHVYSEQTTQQETTSTSYTAALTVDAGDLNDGEKYYCHVSADFGNSYATKYTSVRVKHGSSAISNSVSKRQPEHAGEDKKHIYRWQGIITAASGDDVVVEFKTTSGGTPSPKAYLDNICVLLINLEGLTEGDDTTAGDYRFVSQSSSEINIGAFTDHADATIKHSGSGDEDWLVIGNSRLKWIDDIYLSFYIGLSDGTSELPQYSLMYENYSDEFVVGLERVYTIDDDTDFSVIAMEQYGVLFAAYLDSSIFCLNLDVFESHSKQAAFSSSSPGEIVAHGTDAAFATTDPVTDYTVKSVSHAATTAGKHWILGGVSTYDPSNRHSCYFQLRHGADNLLPSGSTGGEHEYEEHTTNTTDRLNLFRSVVYDVPDTDSITYSIDADCAQGSTAMDYYDPRLYVIPLELYSASVDIDLTIPAVGTVSVDGLAPTVETSVEPTVGAASGVYIYGYLGVPALETSVEPTVGDVGTVTATGLTPTLESSVEPTVGDVGTVTSTGLTPTLESSVEPTVGDVGTVAATALTPTAEYESILAVSNVGTVSTSGLNPTNEYGSELSVENVSTVSVTGLPPTLQHGLSLTTEDPGTVAVAGLSPTINYGIELTTTDVGSISVTSHQPSIIPAPIIEIGTEVPTFTVPGGGRLCTIPGGDKTFTIPGGGRLCTIPEGDKTFTVPGGGKIFTMPDEE